MLVKVKGILDFNLEDVTKKHKSQSSWKRTAVIRTDCEMAGYYAWFLKKRFNLELNKNLRGSHVTIINDRIDVNVFNTAAQVFNGRECHFYHELEPKSSGRHWWLRVYCPEGEAIRESIGLSKDPYFGFHLTIGLANERNIEHSEYILRQCQMFNLTSNEPRKNINEYDIKEF
jgi:hypothetical protein